MVSNGLLIDETESDWFKRARARLLFFVMSQSKTVRSERDKRLLAVPFEFLESCDKTTTCKDVKG